MKLLPVSLGCLALSLAACAEFPSIDAPLYTDGADGTAAGPPQLQPLDPVLAAVAAGEADSRITPASQAQDAARIAALNARAARLRGPVLSPGDPARVAADQRTR